VVVALLALIGLFSNVRQIPPDSRAVVLRFGAVEREQGAGLLLAWPRPIERVILLPAAERQLELRIARFDGPSGSDGPPADPQIETDPRRNDGFLLTGDGGVVHLGATLFYRITDPASYLLAGEHVQPALIRLFAAAAVAVCAARDIDAILVARPEQQGDKGQLGRERLRGDLTRAINRRLDQLAGTPASLGVTVDRVDLVAALPASAKAAYDQVLTVSQAAEEGVARARTYAEGKAQEAVRERDRILTEANAAAAETVSQASSRTAAIRAIAEKERGAAGAGLLERIYADRIGAVLKKARQVDTLPVGGGLHALLPGVNP
jgi:regulator of protease activity HflC (stomatin/prohibitin superfamily)